MSFRDAAIEVLQNAKQPLSIKEILELALARRLVEIGGKTPEATMGATIYADIKRNGESSQFKKVGKGKFTLRTAVGSGFRKNSFKDAAYTILKEAKRPLKFGEISKLAIQRGIIESSGKTPEASMGAQLYTAIKSKDSVFVQLGKNQFGLNEWDQSVIEKQIQDEESKRITSEVRSSVKRSIVGDPINVNGFIYGPINEMGVVFLFSKLQDKLGIVIENIQAAFPDARGRRKTSKGWEEVWIEFEYVSSNFKQHGHEPKDCDLIVCWEHDWMECPLEVIELKKVVSELGKSH